MTRVGNWCFVIIKISDDDEIERYESALVIFRFVTVYSYFYTLQIR